MNAHQLLVVNSGLLAGNLTLVICNCLLLRKINRRIRFQISVNEGLQKTIKIVQEVYQDIQKLHHERFPD